MKMIINGKTYDTEKAKFCAKEFNGFERNDLRYCTESLYKKRTGEFFLNTRYASGERITPLTLEKAKEWVLCHIHVVDLYEKIFGKVKE